MTQTRTAPSRASRSTKKAETHERILSSASGLVRREGFGAATVDRVMGGAGLTVGGFYAHFSSREAMNAEVLRRTLSDSARDFFRNPADPIGGGVKRYLSRSHRDSVGTACPLPAVLSELTHAPQATRHALAESLEAFVQEYAANRPELPPAEVREQALATFAMCVGGLTLARALHGEESSNDMLAACIRLAPGNQA